MTWSHFQYIKNKISFNTMGTNYQDAQPHSYDDQGDNIEKIIFKICRKEFSYIMNILFFVVTLGIANEAFNPSIEVDSLADRCLRNAPA
jgi:hypothetical protein